MCVCYVCMCYVCVLCVQCVCVMCTCVMFVLCVVDPPVKKSTLFSSLTTGATGRQSVCSTLARKVLNMLVSGSPSLPRLFTSSTARPALYIAWDTGRRRPGEPIISELFLNREQCSSVHHEPQNCRSSVPFPNRFLLGRTRAADNALTWDLSLHWHVQFFVPGSGKRRIRVLNCIRG